MYIKLYMGLMPPGAKNFYCRPFLNMTAQNTFATTNVMSSAIRCQPRAQAPSSWTSNCLGHQISGCKHIL